MGVEYVKSKYVNTLDKVGELLQQIDAMKKKEAQRNTSQQLAAAATAGDAAAIEEHEARERQLNARIQSLTEDNDLLRRENELNNGWYINQQGLIESLERVNLEKEQLDARVKQLEKTLQINSRKWGGIIAAKKVAAVDDVPPRMHFNQGSYNQFFNMP